MFKFKNFVIIFASLMFLTDAGFSYAQNVAERFSDHDPNSTARINHGPLSEYLQATVLPVGRSYRIIGNDKPDSYTGSRIKTSKSLSPSRHEGSRLLLGFLVEGHKDFFISYQEGLERLSNRRPLSDFNKNEQAAFWLNLYNVIVINKLVEEYPISNLKSLKRSKRGKQSFWDEKVTTIEGVALSLHDIEKILFTNFDAPEVAFGLWQGSIGGPKLVNYAYTGRNVWRALENNAVEFVNSNRGLRPPTGSKMNVSDYFEWVMPAFGTSEAHVLSFIKEYADPNFVSGISRVSGLNFKLYDWKIADLSGGNKHSGQSSQLGGVLTAGTRPGGPLGSRNMAESVAIAPNAHARTAITMPLIDVMGFLKMVLDKTPTGPMEGLSSSAMETLTGIRQNTKLPVAVITSEECAPDEDCSIVTPDDQGA